ncbi:MAG: L-threonylcarbamoyladenylate synthase [Pseudomonadota bacterium]|nr:L-threonylcarbamoyladenylate synthase [Pseudomonadota bacterium]
MSQYFQVHPDNPQRRLLRQSVDILGRDGVIAYPSDSAYALGCRVGNKQGADRIRQLRRLPPEHNFTLVCRDLSELATYAKVDNDVFRLLKTHTPGPYTFLLTATKEVPRRLVHPKRKTIGIRVPDHRIVQALLEEMGEPLMSVSLILPGEDAPMNDPVEIRTQLEHQLDLVIDGGTCPAVPTTVVDLSERPRILRYGGGDPTPFEALTDE